MNELALFAGAGGGILGGRLIGWRTRCAVEIDPYARDVLLSRQRDGCLEPFPIWDDVTTFDGRPWRGHIDIVTGGFPCQDISAAGKGAGITGARSGLWAHMARIIGEVRPRYVLVENSPMLVSRGLERVLSDLAEMWYDAEWGVVGAHHAGAPHKRDRIWVLAHTRHGGRWPTGQVEVRPDTSSERSTDTSALRGSGPKSTPMAHAPCVENQQRDRRVITGIREATDWWRTEPNVDGMADGLAADLDIHGAYAAGDVGRVATGVPRRGARLKCIGNGQVPAAMVLAWTILKRKGTDHQ